MPVNTWEIEIRTDHDDPEKNAIMTELVRIKAKELLTQAMLLQDRRPPQIAVKSGDMFESTSEIMLIDEIPDGPVTEERKTEGAHSHNAEVARVAGYTVSDRADGWHFNDPDGEWGIAGYATEAIAWEHAYSNHITSAGNAHGKT